MKRRICIAVALLIFAVGIVLALKRNNPLDKAIGDVVVTCGDTELEVDGYKVCYNNGGEITEVDNPELSEINDLGSIIYDKNSGEEGLSVSYSKMHDGDILYTVYDNDFKPVLEDATSLTLPGEDKSNYYVEITVKWGNDQKNVTVKYYFNVSIE
jgi:hypothetical protein